MSTGFSGLLPSVGYDDDSQLDPAEAETLEEGMTQPKVLGHGNVLVETFIKKHARKGGETRGSSYRERQRGASPNSE